MSDTLQRDLLDWYREHRRILPWREAPAPYRVWISEIMLQQTRVDTVIDYFNRFMEAFPTVEALAAAPQGDVLARWSGLGYYSRARNIHAAAQQIVAAGAFPSTVDALRALKGVGPYTAGAIASIAFGRDAALVDGNVERVLSRIFLITDDPRSTTGRKRFWAKAEAILPAGDAGDWNQALMELGALVCSPRRPRCGQCPVAARCAARAAGVAETLPRKAKKAPPKPMFGACGAAARGGRVLLARRPDSGLLGGLWELPGVELEARGAVAGVEARSSLPGAEGGAAEPGDPSPPGGSLGAEQQAAALAAAAHAEATALAAGWRSRLGLAATPERRLGQVEHVFTHRRLQLAIWEIRLPAPSGPIALDGYTDARWFTPEELASSGISTLTRKCLALIGFGERQQSLFAASSGAEDPTR